MLPLKPINIQINTAAGYVAVDTQAVKIVKQIDISAPTAFTPNSDGCNDVFCPRLFGIKEMLSFHVCNRWGQLLLQTSMVHQVWNGTFAGKVQGNQVMAWVAEAIGMDSNWVVRKGRSVYIQ